QDSNPENNAVAINWEEVIKVAQPYFDYPGNMRINAGKKAGAPLTITKAGTAFWAYANSDELKVDPQTLAIKEHKIFTDQPIGHQIASSYKAIHIGTIFGTGTKIIYFISCLIATSLPITG